MAVILGNRPEIITMWIQESSRRKLFTVACVPAFNEEGTIARVVLMAERFADLVLVCDDGSTDMSGIIAEGLRAVGCGISGTLTEIMNS